MSTLYFKHAVRIIGWDLIAVRWNFWAVHWSFHTQSINAQIVKNTYLSIALLDIYTFVISEIDSEIQKRITWMMSFSQSKMWTIPTILLYDLHNLADLSAPVNRTVLCFFNHWTVLHAVGKITKQEKSTNFGYRFEDNFRFPTKIDIVSIQQ